MPSYAATTEVSVERSKMEIEQIVRRYGADGFLSGWEGDRAMVQFRCQGRYVRFLMTLPDRAEKRFTQHSRGARSPEAALKEWEQACRQKWRALALMIKAKLEAVESGIVSFEQEFLPHVLPPDGTTVYEQTRAAVALAYEQGTMPKLLPDFRSDADA
ncbi:hypothetical protein [Chelatococcus reniformis]|uniref:Uncharacterized protein n=1 Tax=Chelatococcus reniformis TaxID=1494448 RepID=A0A916UEG5_9HYPH|nr:hypothetical protein [Chelatococcus reniformis]GGC70428.1 hypothetical protein GCM10010994_31200 [Chelatococcus reniformis]